MSYSLICNRTSSTSGTAVTAVLLQMWRGSDMKPLSSSSSSKLTLLLYCKDLVLKSQLTSFSNPSSFLHDLLVLLCREQIQEPTEEELLCQLHQHPHLHLHWWHTPKAPAVTNQDAATKRVHSVVDSLKGLYYNFLKLFYFHLHNCNI